MGVKGIPEYSWMLPFLTDGTSDYLARARNEVGRITRENIFPHFTDHSLTHCDRVAGVIGKLLTNNLARGDELRMTDGEILVLGLASILHDVGMYVPSAHGLKKSINDISDEERSGIRKNHGIVSGQIVRSCGSREPGFVNIYDDEYYRILPLVARVCENHQSSIDYDPMEVAKLGGQTFRIGLLSALLRIADMLDCDSKRVAMDSLSRFTIPCESVFHWIICHYVDSVVIDRGMISIYISYPDTLSGPVIDRLSQDLINRLKKEYDRAEKSMFLNGLPLLMPSKVSQTDPRYVGQKRPIPEDCLKQFASILEAGPPTHVEILQPKERIKRGRPDFISYWGFIGNPFLDRPVHYGHKMFIETGQVSAILGEIEANLEGESGDLRFVSGDRGVGKTTLFRTIQGYLESKHGSKYEVKIIDVADKVVNIRSAADLHQVVIGTMLNAIGSGLEPSCPSEEAMRRGLVLCIDSLDRLPNDKTGFIPEFFKTAQKALTDLMDKTIVLMSCSDDWFELLSGREFSYLRLRNRTRLTPFDKDEVREMLEKRIMSSGVKYADVFAEECDETIFALSNGNPRSALEHTEAICRLAAEKAIRPVTREFIGSCYVKEFRENISKIIDEVRHSSNGLESGLTLLDMYHTEMENRNLDPNEGWAYLINLTRNKRIEKDRVGETYRSALRYLTEFRPADAAQSHSSEYRLNKRVGELFATVKDRGYNAQEFISVYSAVPLVPSQSAGLQAIVSRIAKEGLENEKIKLAYDHYRFLLERRNETPVHLVITQSWNSIEYLILAILERHTSYDVNEFEHRMQKAYRLVKENESGKPRPDNGHSALASLANELLERYTHFLDRNGIKTVSLGGIKWIKNLRNDVQRGSSELLSPEGRFRLGAQEKEACFMHLQSAITEMLQVYLAPGKPTRRSPS